MIDLNVDKKKMEANAKYCKEKGIILPTIAQMQNPDLTPAKVKDELKNIGLWDVHPRNLFRITWKNEPKTKGGLYGDTNYLVLPPELTGCKAKIIALCGKWFPTGAHKVGASFACLAPRLVTGQFNPAVDKAVWPSTGNYCRGGAYISALLACKSIAILPAEMSKERFEWLKTVAGEVIATPGCESNVKEIFDKCWELRKTRNDSIFIFNQFEELGNPMWHYNVTGHAAADAVRAEMKNGEQLFGSVFSSGSGGTMGAGYYLKSIFKNSKMAVAEALQCPTIVNNGFGGHRIEGIGDKHIPWIHDMKNTDMGIAVDDEVCVRMLRLINEPQGRELLKKKGVSPDLIEKLNMIGISGLGNLISAIKMAKYYECTEKDVIVTVFTDSLELYGSRLTELTKERGAYNDYQAHADYEMVQSINIDNVEEFTYYGKRRVHNLKYYTWIEQQAKELKELNDQWYDHDNYWNSALTIAPKLDELINQFNDMAK